ncbi:helix-turn-helix transcriptional regulator [Alkalimonas sp. NCh-2]|uniref:helix-turn-helix transcriptional regulator n=1 Tax=Alkalimonas sp. NCh-2 TaxID=3144846 RepID=UPI0031F60B13
MNRITEWREKAGITQADLAKLCGWQSQGRISNYESGARMPSLHDCRLIVSALKSAGVSCCFDDVFPPSEHVA